MKTVKTVLTLAIASQFLSACGDSFHTFKNTNQGTTAETMGTGDSGGGNAIDFKMLESHIIDPRQLPAVKQIVEPILRKSLSAEDQKAGKNINYFATKNWYLAPINLSKIPKEVLGVEFVEGKLQQVALQTKDAVWIDSHIFNNMSLEQQAQLIMHEVVMGIYLYRFLSVEDLISNSKKMGFIHDNRSTVLSEIASMKPEPTRRLEAKDYERIRAFTAFAFKEGDKLTAASWDSALRHYEIMDSRFAQFSGEDEATENSNSGVRVDLNELLLSLKAAKLSGSISSECLGVHTKKAGECNIDFTVEELEGVPHQKKLNILITDPKTGMLLQKTETNVYKDEIQATVRGEELEVLLVDHVLSPNSSQVIGSMMRLTFERGSSLRFKLLISNPFVAVGEVDTKVDNRDCKKMVVEKLHPQDLTTDVLAVVRKGYSLTTKDEIYAKAVEYNGITSCP
ncbi:MAG: hypothetical protein ACLGGX_05080 [Bdellovibrionia bacterium]